MLVMTLKTILITVQEVPEEVLREMVEVMTMVHLDL